MKTKLLALLFVALAPCAVLADGASYRYVEANYQFGGEIDAGFGAIDTDGYGFKASLAMGERMFFAFDYLAIGTDPSGLDLTNWSLAVGLHGDTFYAKAGIENGEIDACALFAPPCSTDDSGYNIDFGMRTMVTDAFELSAHVGYSDLGDLDTFTNYGVGAVLLFSESAGVTFNYDLRAGDGVDITTMGAGLRINFD